MTREKYMLRDFALKKARDSKMGMERGASLNGNRVGFERVQRIDGVRGGGSRQQNHRLRK